MFSKPEIQLIGRTLVQKKEWLVKNLNNPEHSAQKEANRQTLDIIDSVLKKLTQLGSANQSTNVNNSQVRPAKSGIHAKRAELKPSEIRVLVVDDDNLIASIMHALLRSIGIAHIDIAEDGLKAITMLYDANPVYDLVLCDWNMPIKNGIDVHNAMRASERYADTCFMLVTAVTEAKQIKAAIEDGVDDYVVKPIEEKKIVRKIARYFPQVAVEAD